uniref:Uncharacterized protein n=1 Tax=Desulfomonile tiedjei TaxID=2358 RepID=A0A7C4EVT6_9BACT
MIKEKTPGARTASRRSVAIREGVCFCILCAALMCWVYAAQAAPQSVSGQTVGESGSQAATLESTDHYPDQSMEKRIEKIEKTLESIRVTGEKAEDRSYFNKLMSMELIRYVRIMVIVLIVIAIVFPLTLWLLSKKRLLALSGLSDEVTATLLLVEERQAKLANLLREIQVEIDYMENMSAPDLKKLIEQAEKYLKQNERDLRETGARLQKNNLD